MNLRNFKSLRARAAGIATVILLAGSVAQAALEALGDPFESNSWGQRFILYGVGNFSRMEIFWISGSPFETPGFRNFSDASWSGFGGDNIEIANGSRTRQVTFSLEWFDPRTAPTAYDFYAWDGNICRTATRVTWDTWWSFGPIANPHSSPVPVPEPATVLAGALLLLPFAAGAIRRLRGRGRRFYRR